MYCLERNSKDLQIEKLHILSLQMEIILWSWVLLGSKFCIILAIFHSETLSMNRKGAILNKILQMQREFVVFSYQGELH